MLRWLSAGESHGPAMGVIVEGLPAGLPIAPAEIDHQLWRRQQGHGRGGRMKIERDRVRILAGLRHGLTLGSPLLLCVDNLDHANWAESMAPLPVDAGREGAPVRVPRPGHADLPGALKYGQQDIRNILERASARETVNRVLLGAVARQLLSAAGITVASQVLAIGSLRLPEESRRPELDAPALAALAEASPVRCIDGELSERMIAAIDEARAAGDSLGGWIEVRASGLPVGLGSHVHADRRLDARLGAALLGLPAIKGLEIGEAFAGALRRGSEVLDEILPAAGGAPRRASNRMGGLEGGMSTGESLVLRLAMKPLSTLRRPLSSVRLPEGEPAPAHRERSDTCAVPAAAVVAEHAVAWELACAWLEVFGADSWEETLRRAEGALRPGARR
jgi:chorismate synthase